MRLRDRNKFPPGGFRFTVPQTNWSISPWISFDAAVGQIIAHRQQNAYQTQINKWSLDPAVVAQELDAFNVAVCQQMGWTQFIGDGGNDPPKLSPLSQLRQSVRRVAAGVETIREWEIAGGNLVPQELSEARAKTCSVCPKNGSGDLLSWFTLPAAELIKAQLESRNNLKIHTNYDPLLGVCEACSCPLKLKVHCPIDIVNAKLKAEDRAALDVNCWILSESCPKTPVS